MPIIINVGGRKSDSVLPSTSNQLKTENVNEIPIAHRKQSHRITRVSKLEDANETKNKNDDVLPKQPSHHITRVPKQLLTKSESSSEQQQPALNSIDTSIVHRKQSHRITRISKLEDANETKNKNDDVLPKQPSHHITRVPKQLLTKSYAPSAQLNDIVLQDVHDLHSDIGTSITLKQNVMDHQRPPRLQQVQLQVQVQVQQVQLQVQVQVQQTTSNNIHVKSVLPEIDEGKRDLNRSDFKTLCTDALDNSSLVAYFPFDSPSPLSYVGSTGLTTTDSGQTTVPGHVNDALSFTGSTSSYFQIGNLGVVGTVDQSFSISLWINPTVSTAATIVHVSLDSAGIGGWCLPFIGFTTSGQIAVQMWQGSYPPSVTGPTLLLNTWNHVVETFSVTNGLKLYINGSLYSTNSVSNFAASGSSMYLTVASSLSGYSPACSGLGVIPFTSYPGGVDELRIYSRELIAQDVCTLFYYY
ncbi:unnamed protein product [Didymodactylos carnosus]|uniref:LamG-like jellyroll fold domain-containing protein n=1 Tax=Didymodactylos carnosus TaxID=1234261 RepID=A0A814LGH4_9BILA|nr:unnamed protein product [Didymodactylos carnosus]CAF1064915.1 unnamed protein product [Didymodactylos carnosus]CAF3711680.1 unnamed protein product [Didymodactylos carnosus]CAF3832734.1 unnamed protein product [Didymodactylos carnosus]